MQNGKKQTVCRYNEAWEITTNGMSEVNPEGTDGGISL
jgi:hypothetical protein